MFVWNPYDNVVSARETSVDASRRKMLESARPSVEFRSEASSDADETLSEISTFAGSVEGKSSISSNSSSVLRFFGAPKSIRVGYSPDSDPCSNGRYVTVITRRIEGLSPQNGMPSTRPTLLRIEVPVLNFRELLAFDENCGRTSIFEEETNCFENFVAAHNKFKKRLELLERFRPPPSSSAAGSVLTPEQFIQTYLQNATVAYAAYLEAKKLEKE